MGALTPWRPSGCVRAAAIRALVSSAIWLWTLLLPHHARALDPGKSISQYTFKAFSAEVGLSQSDVIDIAQTPDGYLWLATNGGLVRFNGSSFVTFTTQNTPALRSRLVTTLLVDGTGTLWVGAEGGGGLVRLGDGGFEPFDSKGLSGRLSVISGRQDSTGRFWFGTWTGLVEITSEGAKRIDAAAGRPFGSVFAIAEDKDKNIWFGTAHGVFRLRTGNWEAVALTPGSPEGPVRAFALHPDGGMWVGTDSGLFLVTRGGIRRFTTAQGLAHDEVSRLLLDRNGNLWVATGNGLTRYRGGKFESHLNDPATSRGSISALFEDREGNLWAGTHTNRLLRFGDGVFTSVSSDLMRGRTALAVQGDRDGRIWIGTKGTGLLRLNGAVLDTFTEKDGLCTNTISALAEDRFGAIWIGGGGPPGGSLCRFRDGRFDTFNAGLGFPGTDPVLALHSDLYGGLWVGSGSQLFLAGGASDGRRLAAVPVPWKPDALPSPTIRVVHVDAAKNLWLGTSRGIYRRRQGAPQTENQWDHFTEADGLAHIFVLSFLEGSASTMWIGTFEGFNRYRDGGFFSFKAEQGFVDDAVFKILEDGHGDLWACSPRGVFRISLREVEDVAAGRSARLYPALYGAGDGLNSYICEGGNGSSGGWKGHDGKLWFPTSGGLAFVEPGKIASAAQTLPMAIERVIVDGVTFEPRARGAIPPGPRNIEISYAALTMTAPEKLHFRYRLSPFDSQWVQAGDRRAAYYTNLLPGNYRFLVAAAGPGGGGGSVGEAAMDLRFLPFVRETAWFRLLMVVFVSAAVAGVAILVHRQRVKGVQARHQIVLLERTRMARELHDTLAQGLTGIAVQLEAADHRLDGAPVKAKENINQARAMARSSLAAARRAVWDLRQEKAAGAGKQGALVAALSAASRDLSPEVPVRVQVNGPPRSLPDSIEGSLICIGQEALVNALRYAGASQIVLEISFLKESVLLAIKDNGRGFNVEQSLEKAGHFGLKGMRERAEAMGAKLFIGSRIGEGTEISISVVSPHRPS